MTDQQKQMCIQIKRLIHWLGMDEHTKATIIEKIRADSQNIVKIKRLLLVRCEARIKQMKEFPLFGAICANIMISEVRQCLSQESSHTSFENPLRTQ